MKKLRKSYSNTLCAGESGKSTVMKQIRILNPSAGSATFETEERKQYRAIIRNNVISGICNMINSMVSGSVCLMEIEQKRLRVVLAAELFFATKTQAFGKKEDLSDYLLDCLYSLQKFI